MRVADPGRGSSVHWPAHRRRFDARLVGARHGHVIHDARDVRDDGRQPLTAPDVSALMKERWAMTNPTMTGSAVNTIAANVVL